MHTDVDGFGTPGTHALKITPEEEDKLAVAVRESVRRQVTAMLRRRGIRLDDADACPSCGDRIIVLDEPPTFAFDLDEQQRICLACEAEREFIRMVRPPADIGGEGGG